METFYELDKLIPSMDQDSVLKAMDCYEDSPIYQEVKEEYEEIREEMLSLAEPVGILGFATLPKSIETEQYREGTPVIYGVLSIGDKIKQRSTNAFREGDYVKGLLCDAMADQMLFSLEKRMMEKLREVCREHRMGILKRLEAPNDIPMESQMEAWKHLELKKRFGIEISSGFMFDPVKTSCQVFILTEDEKLFQAQHDCRNCSNLKCRMRSIPGAEVTVQKNGEDRKIVLEEKESLMSALIREGYYMSAPCGGKGRCGKCGIQVLEGEAPIHPEDEKQFTRQKLADGWRLSCRLYPEDHLKIAFFQDDESRFEILGDGNTDAEEEEIPEESGYEIAVDLGTTTLAMELLGRDSGKNLHTVTGINSQRAYGADVISRIQASVDGKKEILQNCIRKDLLTGFQKFTDEMGVSLTKVSRIALAGNTTMGHLLMGYDCASLGVYPFTPVNIDFIRGTFEEILGSSSCEAQVELLPGISTYVGGDITAGLYACGFDKSEEICLLVDLGTNGEMAIGNKDRIFVTSTAAGPAFEGGNITWGMGSIAGAICSVEIQGERAEVKTIQDKPPVGICGTGVVEVAMELVKAGIVEENGLMAEPYFEDGFPLAKTPEGKTIVFTRRDIREIQLAKSAVRAGVETLLLRYGAEKEQISKVYLAGGFGYKLDQDKAIAIGMLPEEFRDRIETVGNSSLSGGAAYLQDPKGEEAIRNILEVSTELNLSSDRAFHEFYMDYMMFE